jgi:RNA polymerase sigma factor (sigma-70 family)
MGAPASLPWVVFFMPDPSTAQLQLWIERMRAGDLAARDELIGQACERLRQLTHRMFRDFARVRTWEETDDVLQNAILRLLHALEVVTPGSVEGFYRLAALHIRRELLDMARHYYGPQGMGTRQVPPPLSESSASTAQPILDQADTRDEPANLAAWCEFHEQVEALPPREREVFNLLWYNGMTQPEAAAVLNVSEPTIKRWWLSARLLLQQVLKGPEPPL